MSSQPTSPPPGGPEESGTTQPIPRLARELAACASVGLALGRYRAEHGVEDRSQLLHADAKCKQAHSLLHRPRATLTGRTLAELVGRPWCARCSDIEITRFTSLDSTRVASGDHQVLHAALQEAAVRSYLDSPPRPGPVGVAARRRTLEPLDDALSERSTPADWADERAFTRLKVQRALAALSAAVATQPYRQSLLEACLAGAEQAPGEALVALEGYEFRRYWPTHQLLEAPQDKPTTLLDAVVDAFALPAVKDGCPQVVLRCPIDVARWVSLAAAPHRVTCSFAELPAESTDAAVETAIGLWSPDSDSDLSDLAQAVEVAGLV